MANISKTYSGDFTGFIAGKLLNAAGMAKGESDRREVDNLEKAKPGSLFAKALQSEFGGDLYSRTLGNFDPRKSAGETDRSSSKEGRYKAQFKDVPSETKSQLEDAERELFAEDDSIPVKNEDAREHISKLIGVGLDVKLIQLDSRIGKITNHVSAVQENAANTQKLLVDQTELLESKFDQILEIFSGQVNYQKELSDQAKVKRRESELEQEKDLSTTKAIEGIGGTGSKGNLTSSIFNKFFGRYLKNLRRRVTSKVFGRKGANKPRVRPRRSLGKSSKTGKQVASQIGDKISGKSGAKLLSKSGKTAATRGLGKFAKFIPGLNIAVGLGEAAYRFSRGDTVGGIMSLGSAIPIVGWGFTIADISRDLGYDPLNTMPSGQQYERGTSLTEPGTAMLHGTEAILGENDRMSSQQDAINRVGSTLVSSSVSFAEASGMGSEVKSQLKSSGLSFDIVNFPVVSKIGRKSGSISALRDSSIEDLFKIKRNEPEIEDIEEDIEEEEEEDPNNPRSARPRRRSRRNTSGPRLTQRLGNQSQIWNSNMAATAVTFDAAQGRDRSGEPGVDFSYNNIYKNYAMFDGEVTYVGPWGAGYGGTVHIRSVDPSNNNKEFDSLYAHFAPGTQTVNVGDQISAGQYLGPVGWVGPWNSGKAASGAGSMGGPHTSLDFYEPIDQNTGELVDYSNYRSLQQHVLDMEGKSPTSSSKVKNSTNKSAKQTTQGANQNGNTMGLKRRSIGGSANRVKFKNSIERRTYNALNSKGFTAAQISAIMANFDIETGGYRTMYQDSGGPGRGLAQWETPGRWDQALEWYESQGKDPKKLIDDVEGQIDWMMHEFTNHPTDSEGRPSLPYGFSYSLNDWKSSSKDPVELAKSWMNWYEAPGTPHTTQRFASAVRYSKMLPRSGAEIDAQIKKNDADKLKYKNDPAGYFGSIPNTRPSSLTASSNIAEEMEEDSMVQLVYVINNTIAASPLPPVITSRNVAKNNYVDQYRMAVLGA